MNKNNEKHILISTEMRTSINEAYLHIPHVKYHFDYYKYSIMQLKNWSLHKLKWCVLI